MTPCIIGEGFPDPRTGHLRRWRDGRHQYVHRTAWEKVNGPIPKGMRVLHRCDNPPCRNEEHLFLGTPGDNNRDRAAKGRSATHERNGRAKLTAPEVGQIRVLLDQGVSMREIGRRFGVSWTTIRPIRDGKTWRETGTGSVHESVVGNADAPKDLK